MDNRLRHQCLIYSGAPSEHIATIGTVIKDKLIRGYRCLYLHNPTMVSELRAWLSAAGIDLNRRLGACLRLLGQNIPSRYSRKCLPG